MSTVAFRTAIRDALDEELAADDRVILFGEDIAVAGGVFATTTGLYDTYGAVILAHATLNLPIGIWLMASFIREVPRELEEAARIDGCSTPGLLWRVIAPVVIAELEEALARK